MTIGMLLAHLIGDYLLQTDKLAAWKSRAYRGVLVHGAIVTAVTVLLALPFDVTWWPWAFLIGVVHTGVDLGGLWLARKLSPTQASQTALLRYLADQAIHLAFILGVLIASGALEMGSLRTEMAQVIVDHRTLTFALGYLFLTMPAWILVRFMVYGLMAGSAPDFSQTPNKYVGSVERGLITTCVLLGQFPLIPLVPLPRLVLERPEVMESQRRHLYVAELLTSIALALLIGLGLRHL